MKRCIIYLGKCIEFHEDIIGVRIGSRCWKMWKILGLGRKYIMEEYKEEG